MAARNGHHFQCYMINEPELNVFVIILKYAAGLHREQHFGQTQLATCKKFLYKRGYPP
jgi:hypothetical protein